MTDIATHLGLSRLTVSAVLNNRHEDVGISEETAVRVRAAAAQLGYIPNQLAIATKTGRSTVIGAVISGMGQQWVGRVLRGLLQGARESGYLIKIEEVAGEEQELAALRRFMEQRVAGVFCCNFHPKGDFVQVLAETSKRYDCPVVATNSSLDIVAHRVDSDDAAGYGQAVSHLWELGHRRIAYAGLSGGTTTARVRHQAFLDALNAVGGVVAPGQAVDLPKDKSQAEAWLVDLFTSGPGRPTGLVCGSDYEAALVLRAARRAGLRLPAELSVVGFSDEGLGKHLDPLLTTVAQPFEQMGYRCAEVLLKRCRLQKKWAAGRPATELLPTSLVIRESTAPVPAGA